MAYAVGTSVALNLELAANALEGALGSTAADSLLAGNREDGILLDGNGGNDPSPAGWATTGWPARPGQVRIRRAARRCAKISPRNTARILAR